MAKNRSCRKSGRLAARNKARLVEAVAETNLTLREVGTTSGGHVYVEVANSQRVVRTFYTSSTPGEFRGFRNFKSQLRQFARGIGS